MEVNGYSAFPKVPGLKSHYQMQFNVILKYPHSGQSEPDSNGNERVLHIPQSSSSTEASPLDC